MGQERFRPREDESMYFVKFQTCGEFVGSMFQTELKSFEAQVLFAVLAKHYFLVQKKIST